MCCPLMPPQAALAQVLRGGENGFTFKVTSELVLVSVTVRDKQGALVRGLKQSDFTVLEDGKIQRLQSFDIEDVDSYLRTAPPRSSTQTEAAAAKTDLFTSRKAPSHEALRDRRLMILFLDLSSLESDNSDRAVESAKNFVPTDDSRRSGQHRQLRYVIQGGAGFSSDKKLLLAALDKSRATKAVDRRRVPPAAARHARRPARSWPTIRTTTYSTRICACRRFRPSPEISPASIKRSRFCTSAVA